MILWKDLNQDVNARKGIKIPELKMKEKITPMIILSVILQE